MDIGVVELRQYTLRPGTRDGLIELFDRELVETQEACGMTVIGQFRDLDRPDRFVWLRGFADMEGRRRALEAFYGGPVWAEHGPAANVTMIDFDDVRLLAPVVAPELTGTRPTGAEPTQLAITVHDVSYSEQVAPDAIGLFETLDAVNTYPGLPIRGGDPVVVRIGPTPRVGVPALQEIRAETTGRSWLR
ncbi:NIPSNAP family protein [Nocardioides sp. CN2-186]|uniref:NIPSNAP family protein n=1 Tax=Nocardioides tweenelious TaxID=3156607 RepID=UPI0032B333C3